MTELSSNEQDTGDRVWVVILHPRDDDAILLGRRSAQCNNAGQWGLFGGHVDPGEQLLGAAIRELAEETTIHCYPQHLRLIKDGTRRGARNFWFALEIRHTAWASGHFVVTPEVDAYCWYNVVEKRFTGMLYPPTAAVGTGIELHYSAKHFLKD